MKIKFKARKATVSTENLRVLTPTPKITEWGYSQAKNMLMRLDIENHLSSYLKTRKGEQMPIDYLLIGTFQMMQRNSMNDFMGIYKDSENELNTFQTIEVSPTKVAIIDPFYREYHIVLKHNLKEFNP